MHLSIQFMTPEFIISFSSLVIWNVDFPVDFPSTKMRFMQSVNFPITSELILSGSHHSFLHPKGFKTNWFLFFSPFLPLKTEKLN